jgi:apolipoprotein N-acyltransferase
MAHPSATANRRRYDQVRMASGLDTAAGIWLIISAFFLAVSAEGFWNFLIVGLLVGAMALARATRAQEQAGLSWANAVLGAWLVISPWVLDYATDAAQWNAVISGIIVVLLAVWSAAATPRREPVTVRHDRDRTTPPPR